MRCFAGKSRAACPQGDHVAAAAGHDEKITPAQPPDVRRGILYGCGIRGGHQGADIRKIGEKLGGTRERGIALPLKTLVSVDGIVQIFPKVCADALLDAIADDEERGSSESCGNRKKREEKLRSQTDFSHAGCLPLGMPHLERRTLDRGEDG